MFKPPYDLRDKKSLVKLLKRRDLAGEGGVFLDDVHESLRNSERIVKTLTDDKRIIQVSASFASSQSNRGTFLIFP